MCFYDLFRGGASENEAMTDEIGEGYFFIFFYIHRYSTYCTSVGAGTTSFL